MAPCKIWGKRATFINEYIGEIFAFHGSPGKDHAFSLYAWLLIIPGMMSLI